MTITEESLKAKIREISKRVEVPEEDIFLTYSTKGWGCRISILEDPKKQYRSTLADGDSESSVDDAIEDAIESVEIYRQIWKDNAEKKKEKRKGNKSPFSL
jgi:hypothetical protein